MLFCGGGGIFVPGSDDGGGGVVAFCLRHFWHSAWHDSQWWCNVRIVWLRHVSAFYSTFFYA